jgi:hypothetical protein
LRKLIRVRYVLRGTGAVCTLGTFRTLAAALADLVGKDFLRGRTFIDRADPADQRHPTQRVFRLKAA